MAAKRKSWLGEWWRSLAALLLWAVGVVAAHAAPPLLPSLAETRVGGLQPSAEIIAPADLLLSLELHRACGPPLYDCASDCSVAAKSGAQAKNIERFTKKAPANAKDSVVTHPLPNGGVAAQATSPGRVTGSSAVYEKQIGADGKTINYTKTTYGPDGNIIHVKDKISLETHLP